MKAQTPGLLPQLTNAINASNLKIPTYRIRPMIIVVLFDQHSARCTVHVIVFVFCGEKRRGMKARPLLYLFLHDIVPERSLELSSLPWNVLQCNGHKLWQPALLVCIWPTLRKKSNLLCSGPSCCLQSWLPESIFLELCYNLSLTGQYLGTRWNTLGHTFRTLLACIAARVWICLPKL